MSRGGAENPTHNTLEPGSENWLPKVNMVFGEPTWLITPESDGMPMMLATYYVRREGVNPQEELSDYNTIAFTLRNATEGEDLDFRIDVRIDDNGQEYSFYRNKMRVEVSPEEKVVKCYGLGEDGMPLEEPQISIYASGVTVPDLKEISD